MFAIIHRARTFAAPLLVHELKHCLAKGTRRSSALPKN